jgi:hypothetical protein
MTVDHDYAMVPIDAAGRSIRELWLAEFIPRE